MPLTQHPDLFQKNTIFAPQIIDMNNTINIGIDIGSTTVKVVVLDADNQIVFSDYRRHNMNVRETVQAILGGDAFSVAFGSGVGADASSVGTKRDAGSVASQHSLHGFAHVHVVPPVVCINYVIVSI